MRVLAIGLVALTLAACGQAAEKSSGGSASLAKPEAMATDASAPAPAVGSPAAVPAGPPMLAYEYGYGIEAPAKHIRALVSKHEAACAAAGANLCQVTSSSVSETGEDRLTGALELRAAPAWLKTFRDGLAGEAKAAGGRVVQSAVTSEDLSRQIVDTEARLRAMTTLRDRLLALLASRPGKLADLVELERELARVQGDIDSTQSQLAVMRGRVATSKMTLSYSSAGVLAPSGVWSPLTRAFTDFIGIVAFTLAAMVRLVAWLLPWALFGAGLIWLFRKRLPAWRRNRKPPPEA